MATMAVPRVSVIVATRDRPEMLARCVESILASDHDSFELIVVDQSDVLTGLRAHERLRHIGTDTLGKSAALNVGVHESRGGILAFTDDDCTVPPGWIGQAEQLFSRHPDVDMAFGELVAIDHDPTLYFVPVTHLDGFEIQRGMRCAHVRGGAGANLVTRRSLFDGIGDWDEFLGPGTRFNACEEWDLFCRALASGAAVARAPELVITHWGSRAYADGTGQRLLRGYAYGEGAVIGKHVRLADVGMMRPTAMIMFDDVRRIVGSLAHLKLTGIGTFAWKCRGVLAGFRQHLDHEHSVFTN
jgi:glycosyltransferase involved in cell wall biosynthesis